MELYSKAKNYILKFDHQFLENVISHIELLNSGVPLEFEGMEICNNIKWKD